jgi:hypothetical protein
MSSEKSRQQTREEFYCASPVKRHIRAMGIPTTVGSFRDMVASGSSVNLESPEGLTLIETLSQVTFSGHPQQVNVMDKTSGKTIASIPT